MNWEIGIDIYTLICIKWRTNKNLLYKKISKIKFKNSKKNKNNNNNKEQLRYGTAIEKSRQKIYKLVPVESPLWKVELMMVTTEQPSFIENNGSKGEEAQNVEIVC